ncbi:DMT family transporter [Novosphingobium sp.]|uniref:DMT family transporter n=1 Tax=Novosphingobium sp. TaxID=1874826 RepID=UPI00273569BA|nr:DMT family transporter [Novosphingobium sp.]MDP3907723.1 DMT family transporter [Novosphingobium sp.]
MTIATAGAARGWNGWHFAALLGGNVALALGPLWVRLADTGPVSAGFWRLALAIPFFALLARTNGQPLGGVPRGVLLAVMAGGVFFALDLSSWHLGIELTRLGNATLFGNSGSILIVAWGLFVLRRAPRANEWLAFAAAILGSAILLGRSLQIDHTTLVGDLLCLLAGFLYTFYILLAQKGRETLGSWSLLFWSSLAGLPVMVGVALALGEPFWPTNWTPVIALAITSQLIGQGLLVFALRHFSPLVVGLALLTQPIVSVVVGWVWFGEVLSALDAVGMVLVAAGLVLVRGSGKPSTAG